ncbi:DUF5412 domain-containing protein [Paenibacillus oryzisoli]|uniref:DUF5412 domain-containing protein n=1 Tax=Paenibacillus oryzisoli TaxID=1850517 RepID=A0A198AJ82_9BACL|nr:DUF5412 domain-containing protein [Paenibacillus oryzisoli]OAS21544.1 hypothetical protein A8708_16555 [Paenibacillus oryzisoli]
MIKILFLKLRELKKVLKFIISIVLLLICLISYGIYWAFFDMNLLPTGDLIDQSSSPNGKYTMNAYITSGGATTDFAVRAELVLNKSSKNKKNIYWNYREENAYIERIDDNTVRINDHDLKLPNEKYDFRKD